MKTGGKVTFLVPGINNPVIGAATSLARLLEGTYDVDIVGPDMGDGVCDMYRGCFPYRGVDTPRIYRFPDYWADMRKVERAITHDGRNPPDVVIAVKAFMQTVPVALRIKKKFGCRVFTYLDEWDGALWARLSLKEKVLLWLKDAHHPCGPHYVPFVERMIKQCDGVIGTTTALAKRFDGVVLPVGVDVDVFSPARFTKDESEALRAKYGLTGKSVIGFGGVVRPHKGIEVILDALVQLGRSDVCLCIIGPRNEHVRELQEQEAYRPYLICTDAVNKSEIPGYLAMSDMIVLPLQDDLLAQTQMPCKIFEAMAMAKPVVGTDVSDLAWVLEGCGLVIPPGDTKACAEAVGRLVDDPVYARELGKRAREKCICEFSVDVVREQLLRIVSGDV
ncbi:MAG: glycosyltransferase [Spartobacteria bacterium]|nr:glycosyltransferase [Spartobacteria bacterium]